MSTEKHHFSSSIQWPGGRNAIGQINTGVIQTAISVPATMSGPGEGTNPDEMLLGAASTCYTITLAALLERNQIEPIDFKVTSDGVVDVTNGIFNYESIQHHLYLKLRADATVHQMELAEKLAKKAESSCMISKALSGNVAVSADIHIQK